MKGTEVHWLWQSIELVKMLSGEFISLQKRGSSIYSLLLPHPPLLLLLSPSATVMLEVKRLSEDILRIL